MSVHKDPRSPYWHYNFQINGQRYYGSTKCKNKRDAMVLERSNVGAQLRPRAWLALLGAAVPIKIMANNGKGWLR